MTEEMPATILVSHFGFTNAYLDIMRNTSPLTSFPQGDLLVTVPVVYWTNPGVLRHDYPQSEAPIVPQIEDWKWMWVSEDNNWAVVVWCGYNPVLDYNGGFVLSRTRSDGTIPTELEPVIREELAKYGMDLDSMCLTDSTGCVE